MRNASINKGYEGDEVQSPSFPNPHRLPPTSGVIIVIFVLLEDETLSLSPSSSSVSTLSPQLPDNGETIPWNSLAFFFSWKLSSGLRLSLPFSARSQTVCGNLILVGAALEVWLCWSLSRVTRKVMYRMARRRISFLLSFLSGGCVGISFRSSAKAPLTFCCLQRSRLFVKTRRATFCGCLTKNGGSTTSV